MKSHKQRFGHRLNPEVVDTIRTDYGGDFALSGCWKLIKCKTCGKTEERFEA